MPLPFTYQGSTYRMRNRCTIVTRIRTSAGIVGEAYNADEDEPLQSAIRRILHEELAPRVIGLDALQTERVWQAMLPATFDQLRPRWYAMQAIACVDSAVWDAVGKAYGQPLWRLWGGYRDRLPMIGIGGYYIPDSKEAKGQEIEREIDFFRSEQGMVGMKFKVGGKPPEEDAARLARARRHAGDEFLFVVDANQGYTLSEALAFLSAVRAEGIEPRWFEEPTRWHGDVRSLRDVRARGNVNVAAGQSEISRVGMREMMVAGAIDVSNYDASWGGGPTEWRRVAALAAAFEVEVGHHEEAQLAAHLLASVPHGTYVEAFSPARDPIFWQMLANRPALVEGQLPLPEAPGLGWVLDEAFIERHRVDR
ncbi:MAG TPA: mandelate racemase/muconate lactonizing enzyme family protein [Candidatus Limnocylindrales bacterium]|nr:mandelate racemase/muconate lactonizing enzyme family protein [Candidatus Limnocylindrales bacterium]